MSLQINNQVSMWLLNSLMVGLLQVLYTGLPAKHPNFFHVSWRFKRTMTSELRAMSLILLPCLNKFCTIKKTVTFLWRLSLVKSVEDFLSLHNSSIRSASCLVSWCEPRINQSQSKITLWTAMIIGVSFYESPPTTVLVCADFLQSLGAPWYLFATYFRLFALSFRIFWKRRWSLSAYKVIFS